jgi:hypothetical protein
MRAVSANIAWVPAVLVAAVLAAACNEDNPSAPGGTDATDLTGTWGGTSTYPNAPFELVLVQSGVTVRGQYGDRLDRSLSVTGTFLDPTVVIVVDFGDAKLNLDGGVVDARTVQGTMYTSALGNTRYPFTMRR